MNARRLLRWLLLALAMIGLAFWAYEADRRFKAQRDCFYQPQECGAAK